MKLRPDSNHLFAMVKHEAILPKHALVMAALPLMIIPNKINSSDTAWRDYDVSQFHFIPSIQSFMLHEVMILAESRATGRYNYSSVQIIDDFTYRISYMFTADRWVGAAVKYRSETNCFHVTLKTINHVLFGKAVERFKITADEADAMRRQSVMVLPLFQAWCEYNNRRDRYLVSVAKVKPAPTEPKESLETSVSKPLSDRRDPDFGPTIVYLDALPAPSGSTEAKNPGTVVAHPRRGYHYTLWNERFSRHPDYRIYKKMYRKPCYVGDRSTIVNGTVYTVLDGLKTPTDVEEPVY